MRWWRIYKFWAACLIYLETHTHLKEIDTLDSSYDTLSTIAKSFGLFYLIALSIGITIYAFWPSLGKRFDKAARSVLDDEEGPCR